MYYLFAVICSTLTLTPDYSLFLSLWIDHGPLIRCNFVITVTGYFLMGRLLRPISRPDYTAGLEWIYAWYRRRLEPKKCQDNQKGSHWAYLFYLQV